MEEKDNNSSIKPKSKKLKKTLLIVGGVILSVFCVLLGAYLYFSDNSIKIVNKKESLNDVIAIVSGQKIYRKDLNTAIYGLDFSGSIEKPEVVPEEVKKQLFNELIESKVLQKKATELRIGLESAEIVAKATEITPKYLGLTGIKKAIIEDNAKTELYRSKISDKVVTWSSGKFINIHFDLHYYIEPTGLSESERKKLIPKDREYAKNLANSIYNDIITNKISFEQGMQKANEDNTTGIKAWNDFVMIWSQEFTKEDSLEQGYPNNSENFWEKIATTKIGEISKPMLSNILLNENTPVGKDGDLVDGMYVIASREKGNDGEANNYENWLANQEKAYQVTRNIYK